MDLIKYLRSFNRKERFFLVGQALGNPNFKLSDEFKAIIENKLSINIPSDAFTAMDYQLDWIYASIFCNINGTFDFIADNPDRTLNSNQEDIDFLIAFEDRGIYHIILIEAKAGSGWTNKQFKSKCERIKFVFGDKECRWNNIKPYLLITSPRKPVNLSLDPLPVYLRKSMSEIWFPLNVPDNLIKITRCDNYGKPSITGTKWKVDRT